MKLYLAGPMTGYPSCNFPAFQIAARELREKGYEIVSPVELDDPETFATAMANQTGAITHAEWIEFLVRDLRVVGDPSVDGVVVMRGWHRSRGARQEVFTAVNLDKPIYRLLPETLGGGIMLAGTEYVWLGLRRVHS